MENKNLEVRFWSDNKKRQQTPFVDNVKHGVEQMWYPNGNAQCSIPFQEGKRHGKAMWWHEDGVKDMEINYQNGKKHGLDITWYGNGSLKSVINYRGGTEIWRIGFPIGEVADYTEILNNLKKISEQGDKQN